MTPLTSSPTPQPTINLPPKSISHIPHSYKMGNLCGKPSPSTSPPSKPTTDPFSRPGRTLGSSTNQTPRAPVPRKISSNPPAPATGGGGGGGDGANDRGERAEAVSAAARAAEARAKQTPKGKLGRELERQKAQTRSESLNEAAREERRRREVEEGEERRVFN
ncbi:pre-mRNA-processing ATP-dependent RNA helicase PRP5 [Physcia stellaris]|nr:pre-mRNA-processing ATP-dependent RNA helicase PRP5 [Physcia stellaris]